MTFFTESTQCDVSIMGKVSAVAEVISAEIWHQANQSKDDNIIHASLPDNKSLFEILESESKVLPETQVQHVNYIKINDLYIGLSKREADYLYQLRLGHTAKESGNGAKGISQS